MFFQRIVILHLKWPDTCNYQVGKWPWSPNKEYFFFKTQKFWYHWKVIWFRSVILVVNSDITRTYRVSKVVKIGLKIVKLKLLGSLQWVIKDAFFLAFWKGFFHRIIFFKFFQPQDFLTSANLKLMFVIFQKFYLMKIKTLITNLNEPRVNYNITKGDTHVPKVC